MTRCKQETFILLALSGILLCLIFLAPDAGIRARNVLTPGNPETYADNLLRQNQALTAQLAALAAREGEASTMPKNGVVASVYSQYPFGGRSEFTIDAGVSRDIAQGDAVLYDGLIVGKIAKADPDSAVVQTVFDGGFSLVVRVSTSGVNGLLTGGNYPLVVSIAKNADIAAGDIVVAAAQGYPAGSALGTIGTPVLSSDSLFLEAPLTTDYDLESIKAVTVIISH